MAPDSPLTTARDLADGLGHDDLAIIDCRFHIPKPELGEAAYLEGHIPGAVYAHLDRDLSGPMTGTNGRHPLPSVEQMAERFTAWGIDDGVRVVVYDSAGGQIAARFENARSAILVEGNDSIAFWIMNLVGEHRSALVS